MGNRIDHFISNYIVFDLETTGLSSYEHEIIEIGAIRVLDNEVVATYSNLIKPKNHIPYYITNINGISNQMVMNAPKIDCVLMEFLDFVGDTPLLGHNICSFDLKFINVASEVVLGQKIKHDYVDTLLLARKYLQNIRSHSLSNLCQYFGIDNAGAHRALADCTMTNEVYQALKRLHK